MDYPRQVLLLIVTATLVRAAVALLLPLGNDEVYYWEFARHPDWSDFNHPPMVGWVVQLFTLNLLLENRFFIRLGALVIAALNTWLLFRLGCLIKDARAGWYAALLYTASIYTSIAAGVFILPDTPELFFWLCALYCFLRVLPLPQAGPREARLLLLAGLFVGCAMLSKYHGVFLWGGAGLYVLFFNRQWLRRPVLYLAALVSGLIFLPVVIWNLQNDFASFAFQTGRVAARGEIRLDYLAQELLGQFGLQNPFNMVLFLIVLAAVARRRITVNREYLRILLLCSLPVMAVFTSFALFRSTLPHWTGPGYLGLMLIAGAYASETAPLRTPRLLRAGLALVLVVVAVGVPVLRLLPHQFGSTAAGQLGRGDATLDFHGWEQIREGFAVIAAEDMAEGRMAPGTPLFSFRWFPAAHLDYYVAYPLGRELLVAGKLHDVHRFAWINTWRGMVLPGEDAYYINLSNLPRDPEELFGKNFERIELAGEIPIFRGGAHVRTAYVYRLLNCTTPPAIEGFREHSAANGAAISPAAS